jgi:hypothetical protein
MLCIGSTSSSDFVSESFLTGSTSSLVDSVLGDGGAGGAAGDSAGDAVVEGRGVVSAASSNVSCGSGQHREFRFVFLALLPTFFSSSSEDATSLLRSSSAMLTRERVTLELELFLLSLSRPDLERLGLGRRLRRRSGMPGAWLRRVSDVGIGGGGGCEWRSRSRSVFGNFRVGTSTVVGVAVWVRLPAIVNFVRLEHRSL